MNDTTAQERFEAVVSVIDKWGLKYDGNQTPCAIRLVAGGGTLGLVTADQYNDRVIYLSQDEALGLYDALSDAIDYLNKEDKDE